MKKISPGIFILKNLVGRTVKHMLIVYFRTITTKRKFSIISNDCWGGEVYKILERPFNTPFIGLTIMSPCYIKLLGDLKHYLSLPLQFKKTSRYGIAEELRYALNSPVGVLGDSDIEIHFLHYPTEQIALEKWNRRLQRIDWENLYVKYDCGKDYADYQSIQEFLTLPFCNKLVFGKESYGFSEVYVTDKYSTDALQQFKNCFSAFNPIAWLWKKPAFSNIFQKFVGRLAGKYL